jgi:predicted protein tyrosine phosphatase
MCLSAARLPHGRRVQSATSSSSLQLLNLGSNQEHFQQSVNQVKAPRLKLLFICTVNRMRSATAHEIYKDDERFEVLSAGTDPTAQRVLSNDLLTWADRIIVMEKHHRNYIRTHYPDIYEKKKIVCLYIPDEYDYMQVALIAILKEKVEDIYRRGLI